MKEQRTRVGRPTAQESEQKGAQILDAAVQVFTRHGYAGTSMDKIATAASVSKPTLYTRFGSKEDLLKADIEHVPESRFQALPPAESSANPVEGLQNLVAAILKASTDPLYLGMFRLFLTEAGTFPEVFDAFFKSMMDGTQQHVADYVARHTELRSPLASPEQTASTILALVGNVVMVASTRRSAAPERAEDEAEHIVRTVLYGLLPR